MYYSNLFCNLKIFDMVYIIVFESASYGIHHAQSFVESEKSYPCSMHYVNTSFQSSHVDLPPYQCKYQSTPTLGNDFLGVATV